MTARPYLMTGQSITSADALVNIYYSCPCTHQELFTDIVIHQDALEELLYPPAYLYFCLTCQAVKCPDCVKDEVSCHYCPHCLFEVPATSARMDGSRCTRNCFNCPMCACVMLVHQAGPEEKPETQGEMTKYILVCPYCRWDSQTHLGWIFETPTNISRQVLKYEEELFIEHREWEQLRQYYTDLVKFNAPPEPRQFLHEDQQESLSVSQRTLLQGKGFISKFISRRSVKSTAWKIAKDPSLHPEAHAPLADLFDDAVTLAEEANPNVLSLVDSRIVPTTEQRRRHPLSLRDPKSTAELIPERVKLRVKRNKRCNSCNHLLLKWSERLLDVKPSFVDAASDYLPILSISNVCWADTATAERKILKCDVRLENPLSTEMLLRLHYDYFHGAEQPAWFHQVDSVGGYQILKMPKQWMKLGEAPTLIDFEDFNEKRIEEDQTVFCSNWAQFSIVLDVTAAMQRQQKTLILPLLVELPKASLVPLSQRKQSVPDSTTAAAALSPQDLFQQWVVIGVALDKLF